MERSSSKPNNSMKKKLLMLVLLSILIGSVFAASVLAASPQRSWTRYNANQLDLTKITQSKTDILRKSSNTIQTRFASKTFQGDGTYYVANGDSVILSNGVKVKIESIKQINNNNEFDKNRMEIFLSFYVKNEKLNLAPVKTIIKAIPLHQGWKGYYWKDYGAEISLPNNNEDIPVSFSTYPKPSYQIKFVSPNKLGQVNSPLDIYNYCTQSYDATSPNCLKYITYTPSNGEVKLSNTKVSVIGSDPEVVQWYFDQADACYDYIQEKLEIEPKFGPIPIRLVSDANVAVSTLNAGIFYPYAKFVPNSNSKVCGIKPLTHEMTHAFLNPAPLKDVFNEGLASMVEKSLQRVGETTLLESDKEIGYQWTYLFPGVNTLGIKLSDMNNEEVVFVYGFYVAGQGWTYFQEQPSAKVNHATTILYYQDFPIIEIKEKNIPEGKVKVNLYSHQPLFESLKCNGNNYQDYLGWNTEDNTVILADESINPEMIFLPLNEYLGQNFPYQQYALQFYKTSACLWREIDEQIGTINVLTEMQDYQNYNQETFNLFEVLTDKGMDIEDLENRYGINFDEAGWQAYTSYSIGNVGEY
jgi:hypothetical protein